MLKIILIVPKYIWHGISRGYICLIRCFICGLLGFFDGLFYVLLIS